MFEEIKSRMFNYESCVKFGWREDFTLWQAIEFLEEHPFLFKKNPCES